MAPSKKEDKVPNWRFSEGKSLLLKDIISGVVTEDCDPWEVFASRPEHASHDKHFPSCLERLLEKVANDRGLANAAAEALAKDKSLHPPSDDPRGYPVFQGSRAEKLLHEDMDSGLSETLSPKELCNHREEHREWPLEVFRGHIQQEKRRRIEGKCWPAFKKKKRGWQMKQHWQDELAATLQCSCCSLSSMRHSRLDSVVVDVALGLAPSAVCSTVS